MKICCECKKELVDNEIFYQPAKLIFCDFCYKNKRREENYRTRSKKPFDYYASKLKHRCKKQNIEFNLSGSYLASIWNGICPIFSVNLEILQEERTDNAAELDRFDPSKGYIEGNVNWVCSRANRLKNNATLQEIEKILFYLKNRQDPKIYQNIDEIVINGLSLKERRNLKRTSKRSWNKGKKYKSPNTSGDKNIHSKLTMEQVLEIRKNYKGIPGEYRVLSEKYKVSIMTICNIIKNKSYKE